MCAQCGSSLPVGKIYRDDLCPECGKALRSCINCSYYAPGQQYDCAEHITEQVTNKDTANYCDYYSPNRNISPGTRSSKADEARDSFNKLFG